MRPWRVRSSRVLLDRPWLRVRHEHLVLPTGVEIEEFHVIEGPDWVAVLAVDDDGRVIMVDQYRRGVDGMSRELPAGVIEPDERPIDAARRELREETGYTAEHFEPLLQVSTEPVRHTTRAHFFFARGARRVAEPRYDATENIEVQLVDAQELLMAVESGRVQHGVHIGAILLAARRGLL